MAVNKEISNAELISSQILYEKIEKLFDDYEFWYERPVQSEVAAKIVFEKKNYEHIYVIKTDGEIESYEKRKK